MHDSLYTELTFHFCVCFCIFSLVRGFVSFSLVMPAVVIRQRKAFRRKNGLFIYFEGKFQTSLIFENRYQCVFSFNMVLLI